MQSGKQTLANRPGNWHIWIALPQALQSDLQAAIAKANSALILGDGRDRIAANELQNTAAGLTKTTDSITAAGLSQLDPLVTEANKLSATLGDISTKVSPAYALCRWQLRM